MRTPLIPSTYPALSLRNLTLLIALALLAVGCGAGIAPTATPPSIDPTAAPTVTPVPVVGIPFEQRVASDPALVGTTGKPQVVDFFAYWCTVCRGMHPVMEQLAAEYAGQVEFLHIDIDNPNSEALKERLNFTGLRPTIVFLDAQGQEVGRVVGANPIEALQSILDDMLAVG